MGWGRGDIQRGICGGRRNCRPKQGLPLSSSAKSGYINPSRSEESMLAVMRPSTAIAGLIAVLTAGSLPAGATQKHQPAQPPVVEQSASGTIIQPTTTIIPDGTGRARVIVIPRQRSYLDTGTEVSVGDRSFRDYVLPPGGDPGRPYWFFGPDRQGTGRYPLPSAFDGTGLGSQNPF
jgi:hypothetical protein